MVRIVVSKVLHRVNDHVPVGVDLHIDNKWMANLTWTSRASKVRGTKVVDCLYIGANNANSLLAAGGLIIHSNVVTISNNALILTSKVLSHRWLVRGSQVFETGSS